MKIRTIRLIALTICVFIGYSLVACEENPRLLSNSTIKIEYPLEGTMFEADAVVDFKASVSGDAILPENLLWEVTLHHNTHKHIDEFEFRGSEGTWTFPDHGDGTYSELCLSSLVESEKTNTTCVNLYHKEVSYSFESVPSGLELSYNASTYTTPFTITTYVNGQRTIAAPTTFNNNTFDSWSIGKNAVQTIRVGNNPQKITAFFNTPVPKSTPPNIQFNTALNSSYAIGDQLQLSATVTDVEDGNLPDDMLYWTVLRHASDNATSTVFQSKGATLNWTIADHKDDSYFEVCLRATDTSDTLSKACQKLANKEVFYQFKSYPQGLELSYENTLYTTPFQIKSIANARRTIFAPSPQADFDFQAWSVAGEQSQEIVMQAAEQTITAQFIKAEKRLKQETFVTLEPGSTPVTLEWTNGNRLFISEKHGKIWIVDNGTLLKEPFADLSKESNHRGDRGILGLTLHPNFPEKPYVYTLYTYDPPEVFNYPNNDFAGPDGIGQRTVRLVRYTADAKHNFNKVLDNSAKVLVGGQGNWETSGDPFSRGRDVAGDSNKWACYKNGQSIQDCIPQDDLAHASGSVMFAKDGSLLFSIGDGVDGDKAYDLTLRTLDLDSFAGKLLRVDPETGKGLSDNPFFDGNPDSTQSKIYNLGLRNPFRFTLHPETDEPFIADVGWELWEEINQGIGKNFGWPCYEGDDQGLRKASSYKEKQRCKDLYLTDDVTAPLYSWFHAIDKGGAAITGPFYTGNSFPSKYKNGLFIGDYVTRRLSVLFLDESGATRTEFLTGLPFAPTDIKQGPDGNLYIVDFLGRRIVKLSFETITN